MYHLLDNVSLCTYRKNSHKTSSRFFLHFFFAFFIVRLPHWVLNMSLNAQPGVNKSYLLFIYMPGLYCFLFVFVILHSRPI